jgi:hypothetical protein
VTYLFVVLVVFGGQAVDPPPEWINRLPVSVKQRILDVCQEMKIYHPNRDQIDFNRFQGAMYVLKQRYNGTPLAWPLDPVFGANPNYFPWGK